MASIKPRKNVSKKPVWGEPISYEVLSSLPLSPLLPPHLQHTSAPSRLHCDMQSFSRMLRCYQIFPFLPFVHRFTFCIVSTSLFIVSAISRGSLPRTLSNLFICLFISVDEPSFMEKEIRFRSFRSLGGQNLVVFAVLTFKSSFADCYYGRKRWIDGRSVTYSQLERNIIHLELKTQKLNLGEGFRFIVPLIFSILWRYRYRRSFLEFYACFQSTISLSMCYFLSKLTKFIPNVPSFVVNE